jgi:hypothetical protein
LTGTRRTGTAPAVRNEKEVKIADFTAGLPASTPVQDTEEETVHVSIIL